MIIDQTHLSNPSSSKFTVRLVSERLVHVKVQQTRSMGAAALSFSQLWFKLQDRVRLSLPASDCFQITFATGDNHSDLRAATYILKMANCVKDVDRATKQACYCLSVNSCKELATLV